MPGSADPHPRQSATPSLDRLTTWADDRGLEIVTHRASPFDHQNSVNVKVRDTYEWLVEGRSSDSIEAAAGYVLNKLHRLGVEVPA